jgi:vacuolar protein sorting-associated protein 45
LKHLTTAQILEKEVYLVEKLGATHEAMSHMKAAVFVQVIRLVPSHVDTNTKPDQPSPENIELLTIELKQPKFSEYHLFFSYMVPPEDLQRLAEVWTCGHSCICAQLMHNVQYCVCLLTS